MLSTIWKSDEAAEAADEAAAEVAAVAEEEEEEVVAVEVVARRPGRARRAIAEARLKVAPAGSPLMVEEHIMPVVLQLLMRRGAGPL